MKLTHPPAHSAPRSKRPYDAPRARRTGSAEDDVIGMRIGTDIAYDGRIAGGVAAPVAMTVPDTVSEEQAAGTMRLERATGRVPRGHSNPAASRQCQRAIDERT